jgi:Pyrimidine dimer DNA glycosylase
MNMWIGISSNELCRRHLLGLHGELHKFLPSWKKQVRITGRVADNQMECGSYRERHDAVAVEMIRRGFNHKSPLERPDFSYLPIEQQRFCVSTDGITANRLKLEARCPDCAMMMQREIVK